MLSVTFHPINLSDIKMKEKTSPEPGQLPTEECRSGGKTIAQEYRPICIEKLMSYTSKKPTAARWLTV